MNRSVLVWIVGTALGCLLSQSNAAWGRNGNAAGMLYSRGVHAYFAGQDDAAQQYLSDAIESNPHDPRPYYFRAMSRLRQGRGTEARQDMEAGAVLEARAPGRWGVGSALQRVQGSDRLVLEDYRRRARLNEATRQDERNRSRYERIHRQEPEVLRRPVDVPLDELVKPGDPQELINRRPAPPPRVPASTPSPPEMSPSDEAAENPFADDPDQLAGADAKNVPDDTGPAAERDAPGDDLFAPPAAAPAAEEQEEAGDTSGGFDEENPFGDL